MESEQINKFLAEYLGWKYDEDWGWWDKPDGGMVMDGLYFASDWNWFQWAFQKFLQGKSLPMKNWYIEEIQESFLKNDIQKACIHLIQEIKENENESN
jgi:hypothetical protein